MASSHWLAAAAAASTSPDKPPEVDFTSAQKAFLERFQASLAASAGHMLAAARNTNEDVKRKRSRSEEEDSTEDQSSAKCSKRDSALDLTNA